MGQKAIIRFRR